MTAKTFFKKIGRGLQSGVSQLTNSAGKAAGGILGSAAAKYALEAAPLLLLKTGGHIPGPRHKAVPAILHGSEFVLPANAKPTKKQRSIVASNKRKQKKGVKFV